MKNIIMIAIFMSCCMTFQSEALFFGKNRVRRIVHGESSFIIKYPWVVEIDKDSGKYKIECSGSIINDEWVLSAARCFDESQDPSKYTVRDGSNYLEKGTKHTVTDIVIHEDFDKESSRNDIALIKVSPKFKFNENTQPVKLPEPGTKVEGRTIVSMAGHGQQMQKEQTELLKEATMIVISNEECQEKVPDNNTEISATHMCLSYPDEKKCAGVGDQGDPVTTQDEVLQGVVVRYFPCGYQDKPTPTICTRVSEYVDWVKNITNSGA